MLTKMEIKHMLRDAGGKLPYSAFRQVDQSLQLPKNIQRLSRIGAVSLDNANDGRGVIVSLVDRQEPING